MSLENEVIIVGGDHHNTLSIIRCLGKRKIKFKVLIHSGIKKNKKEISVFHSKYVKDLFVVDEKEMLILDWLLKYGDKRKKQIIFPSSDFSAYTIDKYYNQLKEYYFVPGFKNAPGRVVNMMNKYEQKKWADKNNILMAKSWLVKKGKKGFIIPKNITFPCIIKPSISAFGSKDDIHISYNEDDFIKAINCFNNSIYNELIIQEFIEKEYEICAIGCITPDYSCGQVIRKIRENPPKGGGSLTFAKFINDKRINDAVDNVIKKLKKENYQGLYDIEFLVQNDTIYLNEINFRNSGNMYALIKSGILAPYILYLYFNNKKYQNNSKGKLICFVDDYNELITLKKRYISFFTFIHDFFIAKAHSTFDIFDIGVFNYTLRTIIIKKIEGKKNEKRKN